MRKTLALTIAKWLLKSWASEFHVHYNPGRHPLTRMKLNGAVSKNMEKYNLQGFEDYEEERENGKV